MKEPIPASLDEVALISAKTAAQSAAMSVSKWYKEVQEGRAPQAAVREHRYTRWRLSEVKQYLIARAAGQSVVPELTSGPPIDGKLARLQERIASEKAAVRRKVKALQAQYSKSRLAKESLR